MKNKLKKISLTTSIILLIFILFLIVLGNISRKGYFSDFNLKSHNEGKYTYAFRINYYNKIFRNNDIYGVYPNIQSILNNNKHIKKIDMNDYNGTPFGTLVTAKKLNVDEKIDNIDYKLQIKPIFFLIFCISIIYIICNLKSFNIYKNIMKIIYYFNNFNYRNIIKKIIIVSVPLFIFIFVLLFILGKNDRIGYLSDLNLNIDNTLKINNFNVNATKKLFTLKNTLNNKELLNYIYTNDSITNYSYNFKIKYYSKIFKNSDFYEVYIDTNKSINNNIFIKKIDMNNTIGTPFGILVSDKVINENKIDNIIYTLKIKSHIIYAIFLIFFILILCYLIKVYCSITSFKSNNTNGLIIKEDNIVYMLKNDYYFLFSLILIFIFLFYFIYWLFFPGYYQYWDTSEVIWRAYTENYDNWRPIIISLVLRILYSIFGYDTYYLFLINILSWFIGLYLIIVSLYTKFKNKLVILLIFLSFLGNIFFTKINSEKDFTATLILWLSLSIIFYSITGNIKNHKILFFTKALSIFIALIALLWRHNFIVTVYPILFIYLFINIEKINNVKKFILSIISIMFVLGISLIIMVKIFPLFFIDEDMAKTATYHTFLIQISACAVDSNDSNLIPKNWYLDGRNFEDVKKIYNTERGSVLADLYAVNFDRNAPFKILPPNPNIKKNIKKVWVKAIISHPISYMKHIYNYAKYIFTTEDWSTFLRKLNYRFDPEYIQQTYKFPFMSNEYYNSIHNKNIQFDKNKEKIYSFFYRYLPDINISFFVILSFVLFFISLFCMFKFNNNFLIFSFLVSFSSAATCIIVLLFSPAPLYRYISPVVHIFIISLISFITFIYDIGGLKIFIKKLRSNSNI